MTFSLRENTPVIIRLKQPLGHIYKHLRPHIYKYLRQETSFRSVVPFFE